MPDEVLYRHSITLIEHVARVIWKTEKAVIFQDDFGRYWHYLFARPGYATPVVIKGSSEPAVEVSHA